MKTSEYLEGLRREGELLAAAVARADLAAPVPPCPEWQVRDLVQHIGTVHRWAAAIVRERFGDRPNPAETEKLRGPLPDDADWVGWFRAGHANLLDTLATADPEADCWHFYPAPSGHAFWVRRQLHETAIHRVDAEAAAGGGLTPVPPAVALDGVDELLAGMHNLDRSQVRSQRPRLLRIHATDAPAGHGDWYVRLTAEHPRTERTGDPAAAECTLSGTAEELYLTLWNRPAPGEITVEGDAALYELWRTTSAI
ncbi:maleylpyruvate isomerase family mycothiol-dependent enzyme [Allostreptomyces psammosilenae]|uniref:Uncharacterized protein (TIGR03083 family) n=1 Tax=Allostreptomyces psammosilenae TaxID=1892865 RepID=A0A853A348_9ACTN|nr:maleylpyruvate isomerase family mycothiol-dependent enzyme [Allostreptomyces psammosilenae]NYI07294.1 uncharacterized protein (TIGR03083 family) [Allostreptomyces psammosilenae]